MTRTPHDPIVLPDQPARRRRQTAPPSPLPDHRLPQAGPCKRFQGPALRLTVFVTETDQWHHKPLYHEIVRRAHQAGLTGASAVRGIEGYGASRHIHTSSILSLSDNLPLVITIIDTEDKIRTFLPQLDEIIGKGPAVIDPVEIISYTGDPAG